MTLSPSFDEQMARARADLRMGVPIALRSNGAVRLILAAETATPERFAQMRALGAPVLAVTRRRAETLRARAYDGGIARIRVPERCDLRWVGAVADPSLDMEHPMKGPFDTERSSDATCEQAGVRLAKRAQLVPAVLSVPLDTLPDGLVALDAGEVLAGAVASPFREVSAARVPLAVSDAGRVHVFRAADGAEEHYLVEIGVPDRSVPVLARLHSACFTGDVIGSQKCDCGPQLRGALDAMGKEGSGVLLYLNQEGRGIGLANKMRAYALQDQGFDTVEANHRLGFEDDERNFRIGSELLQIMGITSVRLMTNNPRKVEMMEASGVRVAERVPLILGETKHNHGYLATKRDKSGHLM